MKKKILAIICAICVTATFTCTAMASGQDQPGGAPAQSQQSNAPQGKNGAHAPQGGSNGAPAPKDNGNAPAQQNGQPGSQTPPQQPANGSNEDAAQDDSGNAPENMPGQENGMHPGTPGSSHGGLIRYLVESGVISQETADSINEYFSANTEAPETPAEDIEGTENAADDNADTDTNSGVTEEQPEQNGAPQQGQQPPQDGNAPQGQQPPQDGNAPQGQQPAGNNDMSDTLTAEELTELLENNIITQEEYDALSEALA